VATRLICNDESVGGAQATAAMGTAEAAAPVVLTSADFAAVLQKLGGSKDSSKWLKEKISPVRETHFEIWLSVLIEMFMTSIIFRDVDKMTF